VPDVVVVDMPKLSKTGGAGPKPDVVEPEPKPEDDTAPKPEDDAAPKPEDDAGVPKPEEEVIGPKPEDAEVAIPNPSNICPAVPEDVDVEVLKLVVGRTGPDGPYPVQVAKSPPCAWLGWYKAWEFAILCISSSSALTVKYIL
jgi:hypothetical protein